MNMRYEVEFTEDGYSVYDSHKRETVALFPETKSGSNEDARKRAEWYAASLIMAEARP